MKECKEREHAAQLRTKIENLKIKRILTIKSASVGLNTDVLNAVFTAKPGEVNEMEIIRTGNFSQLANLVQVKKNSFSIPLYKPFVFFEASGSKSTMYAYDMINMKAPLHICLKACSGVVAHTDISEFQARGPVILNRQRQDGQQPSSSIQPSAVAYAAQSNSSAPMWAWQRQQYNAAARNGFAVEEFQEPEAGGNPHIVSTQQIVWNI